MNKQPFYECKNYSYGMKLYFVHERNKRLNIKQDINMKTKTFKIGEYCTGGIITVEITGKIIKVIGKEWDFSKGSRRSSDQSNAKPFTTGTVEATDPQAYTKLYNFLSDLTTHYYTEQVIDWIKTKVKLTSFVY